VREAAREARAALGEGARAALDAVVAALEPPLDEAERRFALAWQQLTGPVAAKGVEDTALYVDVRLVARNEPGLDPGWLTTPVAEFHARCAETHEAGRHPVNATSTHDTKRSEDVRMRIGALSELAGEWPEAAARWRELNAERHRRPRDAPDAVEEWLLYQTLVGMWPGPDGELGDVEARLCAYMTKALREGKRRSSWLDPDEAYEADVHAFVAAVLDPANEPFRGELARLAERAAAAGFRASLGQLVLKLSAPGVPDVYWGNERVHLSLVDPDNRRPVDFAGRRTAGVDGHPKQLVTMRGLELRRRRPGVFRDGEYVPLTVTGEQAERVVAFARAAPEGWVVAVAPRLTAALAGWSDTAVRLPDGAPEAWIDALSGAEHAGRMLPVGPLLDPLGVALLEADAPPVS
jgi:(1->4)-alpha-D-glucan 1-alpha-D-glucosylmutase